MYIYIYIHIYTYIHIYIYIIAAAETACLPCTVKLRDGVFVGQAQKGPFGRGDLSVCPLGGFAGAHA